MLIWALHFSYTSLYFSCTTNHMIISPPNLIFLRPWTWTHLQRQSSTHSAGDVFDLLHVLLVWGVIRQSVCLGLGFVVFHLVDDLRGMEGARFIKTRGEMSFHLKSKTLIGKKKCSETYIADFLAAFVSLILWSVQNRRELVLGPLILLPVLPLIGEWFGEAS